MHIYSHNKSEQAYSQTEQDAELEKYWMGVWSDFGATAPSPKIKALIEEADDSNNHPSRSPQK